MFIQKDTFPVHAFFQTHGNSLALKKGAIVFFQESDPVGIYRIVKGRVRLCRFIGGGQRQIFHFFQDGDLLGSSALLTRQQNRFQAEVIEDSELQMIPKEAFFQLLEIFPAFTAFLLRKEASAFAQWAERSAFQARCTVKSRLAGCLLELHRFFLIPPNSTAVILMSRIDLADFAGTTVETTVRILKDFKEKGLIHLRGRRIMVLDPHKLETVFNDR